MRATNGKSMLSAATGIFAIAAFLNAGAAAPGPQAAAPSVQEVVLELDTAVSKVQYTVDTTLHTVHGTFAPKSGNVHFDPENGKAGGEVVVFATSGDSGNSSRDERMHKEILETGKYPDAVFRPRQIEGKVSRSGASDIKVHGVLLLHGQEHELVAAVHAELAAERWTGTAKFDIPYLQWGVKDPSNWLLKVQPVVNVELEMAGPVKGSK